MMLVKGEVAARNLESYLLTVLRHVGFVFGVVVDVSELPTQGACQCDVQRP